MQRQLYLLLKLMKRQQEVSAINLLVLKKYRLEKKIPMIQLATALGMTTAGGYLRIESGENQLKAIHIPILAEQFGISINKLTKELYSDQKVDETSITSTA